MEYYPSFEKTSSTLEDIMIQDSVIRFEDSLDMYHKLTNLRKLDLGCNNLTYIPAEVTKISFLETILLKRNLLKALPDSIGYMANLKHLDVTDNQLTYLPKFRADSKIEYLNLNKNKFERFEGILTNSNNNLKFLYLVNNLFKEIPKEILKMKRLRHLAIDFNKITEIPDWINQFTNFLDWGDGDPDFELKISVSNQDQKIQNKDAFSKISDDKNDVLTISKKMENNSQLTKTKTPRDQTDSELEIKPAEEIKPVEKTSNEYFPDAKHSHEVNINKRIFNVLKEKSLDKESKDKLVKKEVMGYLNENIIKYEQESEISKFSDTKLKFIIKKCYQVIHNYNREKLEKQYSESNDLDRSLLMYYTDKILKPKGKNTNTSTDDNHAKNSLEEIIFSSKLESLYTSKLKLFFQYISNIDKQLKVFFQDLYEESDENNFILIITEISILLDILISKFLNNSEVLDNFGFKYTYPIVANDVISRVFKNENQLPVKILYRLGLQRLVQTNNSKQMEELEAIFQINSEYNSKQKLLKNYLKRLIKICK
jgi:Leucine-rich repeat (LRR) protein